MQFELRLNTELLSDGTVVIDYITFRFGRHKTKPLEYEAELRISVEPGEAVVRTRSPPPVTEGGGDWCSYPGVHNNY